MQITIDLIAISSQLLFISQQRIPGNFETMEAVLYFVNSSDFKLGRAVLVAIFAVVLKIIFEPIHDDLGLVIIGKVSGVDGLKGLEGL
jgi:hypothetical protein